ncbi:MAG: hypothetical protein COA79_06030 [Planctomycetota bacterium]|nr:MAG: hypothetical protein COA79_06030 [Planctomycetota bacterium]
MKLITLIFILEILFIPATFAQDWSQFMRDSSHTGNAEDESLQLPLGLVSQIKLDDAVLTSPVIVSGNIYVVDQMGTAYCINAKTFKITWKKSPDKDKAMGSNTSSPCVFKERIYYGTTAGNLQILNTKDGSLIKTVKIGSPIISAITHANGAIYFQAMDSKLRCFDLNGNEKWQWDHYKSYKEPAETTKKNARGRGHPGSYDLPHYGGGEVSVAGKRIITSMGWDIFCLEETSKEPKLIWCRRAPQGRDGAAPMSSSISGDWVYTAGMGADGRLQQMRFSLIDGVRSKKGVKCVPYPWVTPAVRGTAVTTRSLSYLKDGIGLYDCETKKYLGGWKHKTMATPIASSHTLAKEHILLTTLNGEFIAAGIGTKSKEKPFRFLTPNGKGISSSPIISNGQVLFGCDDGYLYILGPNGKQTPVKDHKLTISNRKSAGTSTTKKYGWTSALANPGNTCFIDDSTVEPKLKLRWAVRGFGHFKTPCIATKEGDLISITLQRTVTCREQESGRIRWRRRLPIGTPQLTNSSGLLVANNLLYVPCPAKNGGKFFCLDMKDGSEVWSVAIGSKGIWNRASPVIAEGVVTFSHIPLGRIPRVEGWDAKTGKQLWQVKFNVNSDAPGGSTDGKVFYYSSGREKWGWKPKGDMKRGEVMSIDAKSGKVLMSSVDLFGTGNTFIRGNNLYLQEHAKGLHCINAKTFKPIWKGGSTHVKHFSLGSDFIVTRGYGGRAINFKILDGKATGGAQLGGATHSCGPVSLTPKYSFAITVGGLIVREIGTGKLLWQSPGFAPRGCVNPSISNGRVFWPSAASGVIFCWEPIEKK